MRGLELRTKRLLLRPWRDADLEPFVTLNQDQEVHEFLSSVPDREWCAEFIERSRRHFEEHRFGRFALEATRGELSGRLIGFCGVAHPTFIPAVADRPELGYRLGRFAWGQGFATEAAIACRDDAFYRAGLPALISLIDPANRRSQRVAEKVGMSPGEPVRNPLTDSDVTVWSLPAPNQGRG
ncbi:MAG TPA: GNAT family N-acetyltransferase [Solirubrobacterales bacterium]|nr:GNAT family N-acetyltransferase [Solirubrobacterales bacterium]